MEDSLHSQKQALRRLMRARRAEAYAQNPQAAFALRDLFLKSMTLAPACLVAVTIPQNCEIDSAPLALELLAREHGLCLPSVTGVGRALVFRSWSQCETLAPGAFGIPEPPAEAPIVEPAVLLAPLLAFDRHGNRLGQGGGYYDRALARLRARRKVLAIGLGFSAQEVSAVPAAPNDELLDAVVTEKEAFWTAGKVD